MTCKRHISPSFFYKDKYEHDGLTRSCKDCDRNRMFRRVHGITLDDWKQLYISQKAACWICRRRTSTFHVDHCHASGAIRGLLCLNCNTGLGKCSDKVSILENLAAYLESSN